jgi:hypothetical protein
LLIGLKCEVGQKKLKNSGSRFSQYVPRVYKLVYVE